jgi:hypothetical protein
MREAHQRNSDVNENNRSEALTSFTLVTSPKSTLYNFNECVIRTNINDFYITNKAKTNAEEESM